MRWLVLCGLVLAANLAQANERVRLHVFASIFPPFSYYEQDHITGISVDLVQRILKEADLAADFSIYPWARAYDRAQLKPNSLLLNIARTPERESLFQWVGEIVHFDVKVFTAKSSSLSRPRSLTDLAQGKVAGLRKDVKTDYLRQQGLSVEEVNSEETAIRQMLAGRIDYFAADVNSFNYRVRQMQLDVNQFEAVLDLTEISKPLYIALQKETSAEVAMQLRIALEKVIPQPAKLP